MCKKLQTPDGASDHSLNLILSSLSQSEQFPTISSKSRHCLLSYVGHSQTNKQTDKPRKIHYLLSGCNIGNPVVNAYIDWVNNKPKQENSSQKAPFVN